MQTIDMFITCCAQKPEIKWAYRHNNDLISEQMPLLLAGRWYPGRLAACFGLSDTIVRIETYCHDASRSFSSEAACQKSIDDMPF
jgi:hypothetical protein